jgi:hypothetical protein
MRKSKRNVENTKHALCNGKWSSGACKHGKVKTVQVKWRVQNRVCWCRDPTLLWQPLSINIYICIPLYYIDDAKGFEKSSSFRKEKKVDQCLLLYWSVFPTEQMLWHDYWIPNLYSKSSHLYIIHIYMKNKVKEIKKKLYMLKFIWGHIIMYGNCYNWYKKKKKVTIEFIIKWFFFLIHGEL